MVENYCAHNYVVEDMSGTIKFKFDSPGLKGGVSKRN